MTCIFCHIIAHELPAEILYEDKDLAVFKDINPKAPVHLLIVPKRHIESVNSLDKNTIGIVAKMFLVAKDTAAKERIQPAYRLMINCGRESGQVVNHLHMHLMGGWGRKPWKR